MSLVKLDSLMGYETVAEIEDYMDTKSDEILKKMFDSFDELKSGQIKSSIHLSFWELKI